MPNVSQIVEKISRFLIQCHISVSLALCETREELPKLSLPTWMAPRPPAPGDNLEGAGRGCFGLPVLLGSETHWEDPGKNKLHLSS